jgi:hypothetical protein
VKARCFVAAFAVIAIGSCTRANPDTSAPTTPPPGSSSSTLPATVVAMGITFDVRCTPVAESLVDIELPRPAGEPKLRAITGVWDHQGIAVLADDARGCGVWALGLADDLSPEATAAIGDEVARGVEHFGVTASPVPREP